MSSRAATGISATSAGNRNYIRPASSERLYNVTSDFVVLYGDPCLGIPVVFSVPVLHLVKYCAPAVLHFELSDKWKTHTKKRHIPLFPVRFPQIPQIFHMGFCGCLISGTDRIPKNPHIFRKPRILIRLSMIRLIGKIRVFLPVPERHRKIKKPPHGYAGTRRRLL